jgi:uncharacterized 2Fe-2S/4Fe-4S cluster protein (DUF4445 family)
LRLSNEDIAHRFALACQSVIEGDATILIPAQETLERRLTTDRTVQEITVPAWFDYHLSQNIRRYRLSLQPPSMEDQRDDLSRLRTALRLQHNIDDFSISLNLVKKIGSVMRAGEWQVTAVLYHDEIPVSESKKNRLVDLIPGHVMDYEPLWAIAVDIGTTTVTLWLVDLIRGNVWSQVSEYNRQISRGEDVVSRIVYADKPGGMKELQSLVIKTINELIELACKRVGDYEIKGEDIIKACIAGNSTMTHLLLGVPANSIRLSPFITAINEVEIFPAYEIGLGICPDGLVDCLPGVASYVGSDITAGVLSSGIDDTSQITLFMDVGTNGEIVLGSREWLVSCACSAGPAFEGAGVQDGMRATKGAIEEVWINSDTYEPTLRVIGGTSPKGICGSGLISLLAELFMTGLMDKAGNLNVQLNIPRIRHGEHGDEYVVAWAKDTETDRDIVITHVDIDNLIRAKAAIYAGYTILAESVGVPLDLIEQMIIGGSFGKYINVEKAIQIGLLPDLPWEKFSFLGNTSIKGAYYSLIDQRNRKRIRDIASRMTYIELSADNSFYEAFMSAMFLPHTDLSKFPSVAEALQQKESGN